MTNFSKPVNLVLLGPPGAGKGTQAVLLKKAYELLHISTGDMLREAIKEGNEIGKEIQGFVDKGEILDILVITFFSEIKAISRGRYVLRPQKLNF